MKIQDTSLLDSLGEDKAIRAILEGTAADVGERFFESLVKNLTNVLNTRGAWVTEYIEKERRLKSFAFIMDGRWYNNFAYDISGTACEKVIVEKRMVHVPDSLLDLYKGNPDLAELENVFKQKGAVSYLGVPLTDANKNILGHLSVIDSLPIPNHPQVVNIFRIFANRASAELQRLRAEKKIHQREEKFRKLFDSTMDAILEIDKGFKITRINPSAEKLFKSSSDYIVGKNLTDLLVNRDYEKIKRLIMAFEKLPKDQQNLWIPGGLQTEALDKEILPTEGSLSKFEFGMDDYYTLILRNEKERIEADKKIQSLSVEAEYLREEIKTLGNFDNVIGDSESMIRVLEKVRQVSETDATVLILGETGTGKEAIARAIHASSRRQNKPLITVNCAAIPATLIESEFFGHEKGSFTGAATRRQGRFALADKGTIFLDEIGELPTDMQVKLLRVLQEGELEPVGSSKTLRVDVRIIAATNRNLTREIENGNFRQDLYFRLNVFPIELPPLRERGDDIRKLVFFFVKKYSQKFGKKIEPPTPDDIQLLKSYQWPGNVRELQNVIERAVITADNNRLKLSAMIPVIISKKATGALPSAQQSSKKLLTEEDIRQLERDNIIYALKKTGWRVSGKNGAAKIIGINPATLTSRMKKLGIKRPGPA